ncbi:MAG: glycosyltransferase family 1 protein, partial [Clostridia bacterium]
SDLTGLREQVADAALLCDLKDYTSLVKHLEQLLNNPNKRSELIELGYKRLDNLQEISIDNILKRIFDEYLIKLKCWKS